MSTASKRRGHQELRQRRRKEEEEEEPLFRAKADDAVLVQVHSQGVKRGHQDVAGVHACRSVVGEAETGEFRAGEKEGKRERERVQTTHTRRSNL